MVIVGADAARDIRQLRDHYEGLGRAEAALNLETTVALAIDRIGSAPEDGLAAPRPYPELARGGERWIKGRYWFAYALGAPPVILAVFFETADIPRRR